MGRLNAGAALPNTTRGEASWSVDLTLLPKLSNAMGRQAFRVVTAGGMAKMGKTGLPASLRIWAKSRVADTPLTGFQITWATICLGTVGGPLLNSNAETAFRILKSD